MRRVIVMALVMAAFSAGPSQAQKYGITSQFLDNGLEIIVIQNHSVPLATIELVAKNGAYTEPPELDGLSHLYEHMFFKANKEIPSQEAYMERQRELGMVFNGTTSEKYFKLLALPSLPQSHGLELLRMPSTSPANAGMKFEEKLDCWRGLLKFL